MQVAAWSIVREGVNGMAFRHEEAVRSSEKPRTFDFSSSSFMICLLISSLFSLRSSMPGNAGTGVYGRRDDRQFRTDSKIESGASTAGPQNVRDEQVPIAETAGCACSLEAALTLGWAEGAGAMCPPLRARSLPPASGSVRRILFLYSFHAERLGRTRELEKYIKLTHISRAHSGG